LTSITQLLAEKITFKIWREAWKEGIRTSLQRQMKEKFGKVSARLLDRLDDADELDLLSCSTRLLTARKPEDVFGN
jgi:hypothetical protein